MVGALDFGMIGVIAKISNVLAAADISIFVVSTYNTDYIFVKAACFDRCVQVLAQHGYGGLT
ncbi:MAG: ACT domain-containing protein [Defluviitaleaceae bacterium]|nr:ACT domain-containing protein [Defluviitaleaceae bacterium]